MELILQRNKVIHFPVPTKLVTLVFILVTCLVNLNESQLQFPNDDYYDTVNTGLNLHTHHHHHNPDTFHHHHNPDALHHHRNPDTHHYQNPETQHYHHNPDTHGHHNLHRLPVHPPRHVENESRRHSWISGTFYSQDNFRGLPMSYFFSGKTCVNFPLHQRMASLKPYGCVMLFKYQDCQGPVSMVFESMPSLHVVGMSDGIASIKNCITDHYKPYDYKPIMRFPDYKK